MLFDTHVHLDGLGGMEKAAEVIRRARQRGVEKILAIGGNPEGNTAALQCSANFHESVYAAVGLDQTWTAEDPALFEQVEKVAATPAVMAIGEVGLDLHHGTDSFQRQKKVFWSMLEIALRVHKPVLVHVRQNEAEMLDMLKRYIVSWSDPSSTPGAIHCFTGNIDFARKVMDMGFMISFSGILTFARADALRDVARFAPADMVLIETDAPLLAPVPVRGTKNEPANLVYIASVLAKIRGCTVEEIGEITAHNALRLLRIAKV